MKYWFTLAGLTGLDLVIKRLIEKCMPENGKKYLFQDKLLIRKHHNDGAIFDSFPAKKTLIYTVSYAMIGFFTGLFVKEENKVKKAGLLLMLSGAVSNTVDRLQYGYVVDYFTILFGRLKRIIFNLGDWFVFVGVLLWGFTDIFTGKKVKKTLPDIPENLCE